MVSAGTEHWASSKKTGDIISVRLMRDYIAAIFINYTPSSLLNEFFLQNSSENDTIKRFKNCLKNLICKSSFRKIYIVLGIVVYDIIAKQGLNWKYCLGTIAFIHTHTHSMITILSLHSHIAHALPQDILRMIEYQKPSFPKHPGGCKKVIRRSSGTENFRLISSWELPRISSMFLLRRFLGSLQEDIAEQFERLHLINFKMPS